MVRTNAFNNPCVTGNAEIASMGTDVDAAKAYHVLFCTPAANSGIGLHDDCVNGRYFGDVIVVIPQKESYI